MADRKSDSEQVYYGSSYIYHYYTPSYNVAGTIEFPFANQWVVRTTLVASGSRNSTVLSIPDFAYSNTSKYANDAAYAEVSANGIVRTTPAGPIKGAIGAGIRKDGWVRSFPGTSNYVDVSRKVTYLYAEANAPLVAPSRERTGLHELEIDISARAEKYDDLGTTSNPRIGLRYVPFNDLTVRATWGTSFKAPSFYQQYVPTTLVLYKASIFGYSGAGTALYTNGGNADLKPEHSASWTLGGDYSVKRFSSLVIGATYSEIDFKDRVVNPINPLGSALSTAPFSPFVQIAPSDAAKAELMARGYQFLNYSGSAYDPSQVVAIVNQKFANATAQHVRGLDLSYRQRFDVGSNTLSTFGNMTWTKLTQQTVSNAPVVELSGTIFNIPTFKARAGASLAGSRLTSTAIVNYLAGERDNGVVPGRTISSWTTVDLNIAYRPLGPSDGLSFALSVSNIFDRDPPRAFSTGVAYPGVNFDSTNSSVLGRFVSLNVLKSW